MKKDRLFRAKTEVPVYDISNAIYLGKGVTITLNFASRPMILALRKKYLQDKMSIRISKQGRRFLFTFRGFIEYPEAEY